MKLAGNCWIIKKSVAHGEDTAYIQTSGRDSCLRLVLGYILTGLHSFIREARRQMNALVRSLIEKAACDNGWEIATPESENALQLSSARHEGLARVEPGEADSYFVFPGSADVIAELAKVFPEQAAADNSFCVNGTIDLGRVLRRVAQLYYSLPDRPARRCAGLAARITSGKTAEELKTEVEHVTMQRLHQDEFRKTLFSYWQGACSVTGIDLPDILRASHIKPWKDCETDAERLNVFNGFLLAANLDALFDRGLITFDDTGKLICSGKLSASHMTALNLTEDLHLRWINNSHFLFLSYHRRYVFKT